MGNLSAGSATSLAFASCDARDLRAWKTQIDRGVSIRLKRFERRLAESHAAEVRKLQDKTITVAAQSSTSKPKLHVSRKRQSGTAMRVSLSDISLDPSVSREHLRIPQTVDCRTLHDTF